MTSSLLLEALRQALDRLQSASVDGWGIATDAELSELLAATAALRQGVERHAAVGAGEVLRRSRPEHGLSGFAQRAGHRTVEEFLRVKTGVSARDASVAARVGEIASAGGALGDAVLNGRISVAAADAINSGLGAPTAAMPADVLDQAVERLCNDAGSIDPDRLQRRAREVRDELDEAGVADREAQRRAARSLRLVRQADGMTRIVWLLDPESAAIVTEVYDRATSPRRGGPRFVEQRDAASAIRDDPRSTDQIASDSFTELLRQSAAVDRELLLGSGTPAVRILVTAAALEARRGHGVMESGESISMATVERLTCSDGALPFILDGTGQILDLGREQRHFNRRQRDALSVRDGGCMWPGCDRPPSWTEAHHIHQWVRDHGRTDLADGLLLCRHHHLRLHNEGWEIERRAGRYWLEPPPGRGARGALLETKSRAVRELLATG
ncbi:MAG TPA: DUF222 domain-containing protein [Pseudolysinimonas sp.]|nr:DUF222 domain-containing protein [Pseudolysinimonas sp.]